MLEIWNASHSSILIGIYINFFYFKIILMLLFILRLVGCANGIIRIFKLLCQS